MSDDRSWTRAEDDELKRARGTRLAWDVIADSFPTRRTVAALKKRYHKIAGSKKAKPQRKWTDDEVARLKHLRQVERRSWDEIDALLSRGKGNSYNKFRSITIAVPRVRISKFDCGVSADRTRAALAERDRRKAVAHASITAMVFGDPLPGRSALDQKRGEARA